MQYKIFWCKTNKYFTEKWLNSSFLQDKSWVFVASCIVTDKAKIKWIKFLKDTIAGFENKEDKIYLSGCGTIKKWELIDDFFTTYSELAPYKDKIILLWEDPEKNNLDNKINNLKKLSIYTRKYLIIQNWCDNYCTFCLTIQARWKHFSRDIGDIMEEIHLAEKSWMKELVITGTNLWAWGTTNTKKFTQTRFPELLQSILDKTSIPRIRISSLGIEYINEELLSILSNKRVYAHLHLSIQSWSNKILKSMNRNYNKEELEEVLSKINNIKREDNLDISLWADFIVGFPWEEEVDFEDTIEIIKKYRINKVHNFPFSAHEKSDFIPASKFPNQISDKIKQERMKRINNVSDEVRKDFLKENSGKSLNLLVEKVSWEVFSWWSENYIALNEKNFVIDSDSEIKRWNIIRGEYRCN